MNTKDQNPAQMLEEFKRAWLHRFGESMPHEMCAGFIAGMAAGLAKGVVCNKQECADALFQCSDMAATLAQLESVGVFG